MHSVECGSVLFRYFLISSDGEQEVTLFSSFSIVEYLANKKIVPIRCCVSTCETAGDVRPAEHVLCSVLFSYLRLS